jgi:hypothetical protein
VEGERHEVLTLTQALDIGPTFRNSGHCKLRLHQ